MKKMKKLTSILLALVMVLSLATTAFAAELTIEGTDTSPVTGHTYEVYQIFTGTLSEGNVLSDIKYGANYTPGETKVGDLVPTDDLKALNDAAAFAKDLVDNDKYEGTSVATLNDENKFTAEVVDGYYLIIDVTNPVPEYDSLSAYMVKIVGDVTINPKSETISDGKKISSDDYADNYGEDDSVTTDGKTSNGAVGSTVDFTLTVNVPQNASGYSYYYCILNDTLSEGLTFNEASVKVIVGDETMTADEDYKLYTGNDAGGKTFQIAMLDAKSLAGKTITVNYSATINENAKIGVEGNPNKFDVDYSNNPNYDYDDKDNDGKPDDAENIPTGKTPEKETRTYVTGIKLIKVDENGNVLTGAQFEITGTSVKYVLVSEEVFSEDESGEYWKLADGTYTTEAPRTVDEYVEKEAGDRDGGYVLENGNYRVATDAELADSNVTLYLLLEKNSDSYASTETKYSKTVNYTVVGDDADETEVKAYVGADGIVYFSGLGEGVYTITETVTPAGYNTIAPITVTIDWTAPENYDTSTEDGTDCTWTATAAYSDDKTATLTLNSEGVFEMEIVNESGVELPETGGMGTTLFYVIGGLLAVAAVVLLITKKRMHDAA